MCQMVQVAILVIVGTLSACGNKLKSKEHKSTTGGTEAIEDQSQATDVGTDTVKTENSDQLQGNQVKDVTEVNGLPVSGHAKLIEIGGAVASGENVATSTIHDLASRPIFFVSHTSSDAAIRCADAKALTAAVTKTDAQGGFSTKLAPGRYAAIAPDAGLAKTWPEEVDRVCSISGVNFYSLGGLTVRHSDGSVEDYIVVDASRVSDSIELEFVVALP